MANSARVGVVLVNFNGRRFLNDCVRALLQGSYENVHPVVVDNASSDGSIDALRAEFPSLPALAQATNLGVAAGNNVGIRYCLNRGDEYILLLNYDTVPDPELVSELARLAAPDAMISGSTYFWDDIERSNSHAGSFNWLLGRLRERFFGCQHADFAGAAHDVDIVDTCCLLIPRAAFAAVGLMDEAYFLYYDDTDFVVRARAAGYRCLFNPAARLRHYERGASPPAELSPLSVYYTTRNRPYFMRKHCPTRLHYAVFLCYFAATRAAALARYAALRRWPLAYWTLRGLRDFMSGRMGPGHIMAFPPAPARAMSGSA